MTGRHPLAVPTRIVETWEEGGVRLLLHRLRGRILRYGRNTRRRLRPTGLELIVHSNWASVHGAEDVALLMWSSGRWPTASVDQVRSMVGEGLALSTQLTEQANAPSASQTFTPVFDLERESSALLYAICRLDVPNHVVETGVARGLSTAMILLALSRNNHGFLTSFDISTEVGALVSPHVRDRWQLVVLSEPEAVRGLEDALSHLSPIDVFLHDSDHRKAYQLREYSIARRYAAAGAVFLSDDVEANSAFEEAFGDLRTIALAGHRKCMGVAL